MEMILGTGSDVVHFFGSRQLGEKGQIVRPAALITYPNVVWNPFAISLWSDLGKS
jgi:hypothetical protein